MSLAHLLDSYGILSAKLKSILRDQPGLANTQKNQGREMMKNTFNVQHVFFGTIQNVTEWYSTDSSAKAKAKETNT